jgi:transketolase
MSQGLTWDFGAMLGKGSARDIFMHKILEIAETRKDVLYICADGAPTGSLQDKFRRKFPDQFIEAGIAEGNAIGIAAGQIGRAHV